jgi:hypothetical protein
MTRSRSISAAARAASLSLCLCVCTLASSFAALADQPAITEARAAGGVLHIFGFDFGTRLPKVTLGTQPLAVVSATTTRIDALIPATFAAGSYLMTVSTGKGNDAEGGGNSDEFWITLGAAGAAGRDGAPGPQGATGPAGPSGTQGSTGAAGPQGIPGPMGPSGTQGVPGPAGPGGTGSTLASIDALGGLPCNLANTGRACRGTTRVLFDPQTNQLSLTCQPTATAPIFTAYVTTFRLSPGQQLFIDGIVSTPNLFATRYGPDQNGFDFESLCEGTVFVLTFTLVHDATTTAPRNMGVTGGSCPFDTVVASNGPAVSCAITMNGNQTLRIGAFLLP